MNQDERRGTRSLGPQQPTRRTGQGLVRKASQGADPTRVIDNGLDASDRVGAPYGRPVRAGLTQGQGVTGAYIIPPTKKTTSENTTPTIPPQKRPRSNSRQRKILVWVAVAIVVAIPAYFLLNSLINWGQDTWIRGNMVTQDHFKLRQ